MPRKEIDYSKTTIYKIVCKDLNISYLYVGSTTQFAKRKYQHKVSTMNDKLHTYNLKVYEFIRNNGGWDNWEMILVESYPCNNDLEKRARERYWYEELNAKLNGNLPFTSSEEKKELKKQYNINNKDHIRERNIKNKDNILLSNEKYRLNNPEKIKEKRDKYYTNKRDEILIKSKEYAIKNKEKLKEYKREYYQKNKSTIEDKKRTKRNQEKVERG